MLLLAGGPSTASWSSAGPLVISPDGDPQFVGDCAGAPLGTAGGLAGAQRDVELAPGATLLLYSNSLVGKPDERPAQARARLRQAAAGSRRDPEALVAH